MNYNLVLGPKAVESYNSLPLSILDEFDGHMERLAQDPPAVAVPGKFPFPENRMVYHFDIHDFEGRTWFFAIHFRYVVDEIVLYVIAITIQQSD